MRFIHLSDLHIGIKLNNVSLIEDQREILKQVVDLARTERVEAIILAGDIYDKSVPAEGAVELLDEFLNNLVQLDIAVLIIPGNHDSATRLSFGATQLLNSRVYIAKPYAGFVEKISLEGKLGEVVDFYLLPFIKPAMVRPYFPEEDISSYDDAIQKVLANLELDKEHCNVLVAHQFVTGASTCDSEAITVGNLDNISVQHFEAFDYVALGHIHTPQNIVNSPKYRYCGTLLKYSFSEVNQQKSVTVVDIMPGKKLSVELFHLKPVHDLRIIRGSYQELMSPEFYRQQECSDYLEIILTDESEVPEAIGRLRTVYPNVLQLGYDNSRSKNEYMLEMQADVDKISPHKLFGDFYKWRNNQDLNPKQITILDDIISEIWE